MHSSPIATLKKPRPQALSTSSAAPVCSAALEAGPTALVCRTSASGGEMQNFFISSASSSSSTSSAVREIDDDPDGHSLRAVDMATASIPHENGNIVNERTTANNHTDSNTATNEKDSVEGCYYYATSWNALSIGHRTLMLPLFGGWTDACYLIAKCTNTWYACIPSYRTRYTVHPHSSCRGISYRACAPIRVTRTTITQVGCTILVRCTSGSSR